MLVLIGKTCSGKDTIKKELVKLGMQSVVTTTTRPMRHGELQDISYHFVDEKTFSELNKNGKFAETTSYKTTQGKWYYGTQYEDLKDDGNKVIILNPNGVESLKDVIMQRHWFVVWIYCSEDTAKQRLLKRGDDCKEAERRLQRDNEDFKNMNHFTDIVFASNEINDNPHQIALKIKRAYEDCWRNRRIK